jgi:hypothetical protein
MERIKEKMLGARQFREQILRVRGGIPGTARAAGTFFARVTPLLPRLDGHSGKWVLLATGLVISVLIASLVWQYQPAGKNAGWNTAGVPGDTTVAHRSFDGLSETFATVREMRDTMSRLARQVEQLSISVAGLERKVEDIQASPASTADATDTLDRLPPPAAGARQASTAAGSEPDATGGDKLAAINPAPASPAAAAPQQGSRTADSHWVINLASFPDQAAADRFMQEAADKGIETDKRRVTIKGREFWRAQVTGFPSSADAIADSAGIKQALGLQDVWIAQQ